MVGRPGAIKKLSKKKLDTVVDTVRLYHCRTSEIDLSLLDVRYRYCTVGDSSRFFSWLMFSTPPTDSMLAEW